MNIGRRSLLAACAGALPLAVSSRAAIDVGDSLGLVIHSFPVHQASERGRRVATPFAGAAAAGAHVASWDGRDGAGAPVADGIYFVRLSAAGEVRVRRLVVLH